MFFILGTTVGLLMLSTGLYIGFEKKYQNRIYPGVNIEGINFGGKTKDEVKQYFTLKGEKFNNMLFEFQWNEQIATVSAKDLDLRYNDNLLADQAYYLGRGKSFFSNLNLKIQGLRKTLNLEPSLYLNEEKLHTFLTQLAQKIDISPTNAQFEFSAGRVVVFKLEKIGRKLNIPATKKLLYEKLGGLNDLFTYPPLLNIKLVIDDVEPKITTNKINNLGIKELVGQGTSTFFHSIENRVYNIDLSSSRINGYLIAPDAVFSFNDAVGDISSLTGYKAAYVIKEGKTVLGDGGGVCQVSTTLFRAALNAGLPIVERWAHAYRVGYYEQDSPPGIDATIFIPVNDLKFKNDTGHYLLIQTITDSAHYSLIINLYGQKDGRITKITKPVIYSQSAPPPDLFEDDPNLPKGVVRQTDFSAWGAKVGFDYVVEKNGQEIFKKSFFSDYRPWQAVFKRGTKE